jgi:hypothetical protein
MPVAYWPCEAVSRGYRPGRWRPLKRARTFYGAHPTHPIPSTDGSRSLTKRAGSSYGDFHIESIRCYDGPLFLKLKAWQA